MKFLVLCAVVAAWSVTVVSAAQAYEERPMRLPATGTGASAASAEPPTWLIAAEPRTAQVDAIARRFGATKLRVGDVYKVARPRARAFAAALRAAGGLRYAEPNAPLQRSSALDATPGAYSRGFVVAPGLAPPAPGAVGIAVIDDLVDVSLPDLATNVRQLNPGPVLGPHGTMVASAAAAAFNGAGVVGIFPSAPVLSIGLPLQINCADAANGIVTAARAGVKIINLSFGSNSDCASLFASVQIAYAAGSLVVAAAGNEFAAGNPVIYPAAYPHVLSVAALDPNLAPSGFSSENTAVDVAAPGVSIPLAVPLAFDVQDGTPDGVTLANGTSFAAPIVSGAAAWLATARPDLNNGQLADVLRRSALDVSTRGYDPGSGFGLIQLAGALALPAPARDVLEPNDGISFIDGSVFARPDPYIWTGGAKRSLGGTADRVEDPVDVYRIRLGKRARARIRLRALFGNPDLFIFRSNAKSVSENANIITRSRRGAKKTDSVTITNRGGRARSFYVVIPVGTDAAGSLNASYNLQLQRIRFRR
ncbi:MAG TPA: S8 family serine peptidase [Solirubrobacteraceae bacterium]|nr:S8 family serine peptidase [Solirubrobacteraceae bacterium]